MGVGKKIDMKGLTGDGGGTGIRLRDGTAGRPGTRLANTGENSTSYLSC